MSMQFKGQPVEMILRPMSEPPNNDREVQVVLRGTSPTLVGFNEIKSVPSQFGYLDMECKKKGQWWIGYWHAPMQPEFNEYYGWYEKPQLTIYPMLTSYTQTTKDRSAEEQERTAGTRPEEPMLSVEITYDEAIMLIKKRRQEVRELQDKIAEIDIPLPYPPKEEV